MLSKTEISIIMGAYNCAETLEEAVSSIRSQTLGDWEFVIIDDGSTDKTWSLLCKLASEDSRIKVLRNQVNLGLAPTLNRCARESTGRYLARMDADDVSSPDRLQKLAECLKANPGAALVSSWMTAFDEGGDWGTIKTKAKPTSKDFIWGTPYCHAPCMMRRSAFEAAGGYDESEWSRRVEDYDLWFKFHSLGFWGINLQESLYRVRDNRDAEHRRNFRARLNELVVRMSGYRRLGLPIWSYLHAFRPILTWLIPTSAYRFIRRKRIRNGSSGSTLASHDSSNLTL